jgi:transcriptional regulator with XRE-family HTH domain
MQPALLRYNTVLATVERIFVLKHRGQKTIIALDTSGHRVTQLRKERGLTQQEMAERLGVSQPVVSDYECGALRLHGELIARLAEILAVSADEILGLTPLTDRTGALKNRNLHRRLQQLERLPQRDQQALLRTIDAVLAKAS